MTLNYPTRARSSHRHEPAGQSIRSQSSGVIVPRLWHSHGNASNKHPSQCTGRMRRPLTAIDNQPLARFALGMPPLVCHSGEQPWSSKPTAGRYQPGILRPRHPCCASISRCPSIHSWWWSLSMDTYNNIRHTRLDLDGAGGDVTHTRTQPAVFAQVKSP